MHDQGPTSSNTPSDGRPTPDGSLAPQPRTWTPPAVEEIHYTWTEATTTGTGSDGPFSYS